MTSPHAHAIAFDALVEASQKAASTRSRLEKKRVFVELLARVPDGAIDAAVGWLVGEPLCGPLGVGPSHLWELSQAPAPTQPTATLDEVEAALTVARAGGRESTVAGVRDLFARLAARERAFFVGALTGSLRQGSLGGIMLLALVDLSGRSEAQVRRAVMVTGSIARAAGALLGPNHPEQPPAAVELFRPLWPMLASSAESLRDALAAAPESVVEWKIDGVRAQVHKQGDRVAVYSRQGNDITESCAPFHARLASLAANTAVLDGEIALVGPDGGARPFQDAFSAIASKGELPAGEQLRVYLFDCLHRDGKDLLDEPLAARLAALAEIASADLQVRRIRSGDVEQAERFYREALAAGHEGVMVKDLASRYRFGARGRSWQKVKEFATADLVVLAAEWGNGRRAGLLSNLHLGARGDDGTFCMVGKTFKGLTDAILRWQTTKLEELATERMRYVVHVRPELVVEVRYGDVQRSPRYPGGIALRFARVVRYRAAQCASEADTLRALVAALPEASLRAPARKAKTRRKREGDRSQLSLFDD